MFSEIPLRFYLNRRVDDSGISGTGPVAYGVLWDNGKVTLKWAEPHGSVAVWDSIESMLEIHGHAGHTVVEWID